MAGNLEIAKVFGMDETLDFNKSVGFIQAMAALDFAQVLFNLAMLFFMKLGNISSTTRMLWARPPCKILSRSSILDSLHILIWKARSLVVFQLLNERKNILRIFRLRLLG